MLVLLLTYIFIIRLHFRDEWCHITMIYFILSQLPTDRRRVKTPQWSPYVVCVHIYIYVVCELRHGESTTSAAQPNTLDSGLMHCASTLHCDTQWTELSFPLSLPNIPLLSCPFTPSSQLFCCSWLHTSPRGLVLLPIFHSFPQESTTWSLLHSLLWQSFGL